MIVISIVLALIIIISGIIIVIRSKKEDKKEDNQSEIEFVINTIKFNPEIIYIGSLYNY